MDASLQPSQPAPPAPPFHEAAAGAVLLAELGQDDLPAIPIGKFTVDPLAHTLTYELSPLLPWSSDLVAHLHGFAPPGFEASRRWQIVAERGSRGMLTYPAADEPNLLAGLAYLKLESNLRPWLNLRAQLRPDPLSPWFPPEPGVVQVLGICSVQIDVFGFLENVTVDLEPARVTIRRSAPAVDPASGHRRVDLAVQVECAGGHVPGIGHVDLEVTALAGEVRAQQPATDFPADMTLALKRRYFTPLGPIDTATEHYLARGIRQFPPFGSRLEPQDAKVSLLDAAGNPIGDQVSGPLISLFHLEGTHPKAPSTQTSAQTSIQTSIQTSRSTS